MDVHDPRPPEDSGLVVRDLAVSYGPVLALRGVSLNVPRGSIVTVLGGNGAGKSTLLRAVSGTLRFQRGGITAGEISFDRTRLSGAATSAVVAGGVVQVPEGRRVFARMTVEENLRAGALGARDRRSAAGAETGVLKLFPVLAERARQRAGLLSGGEQQMLAIGRALMAAAEDAAAGRAHPRPGADDGGPDRRHRPRDQRPGDDGAPGGAERRAWPCPSPPTRTCWRSARWCCRARPPSSPTSDEVRRRYLGIEADAACPPRRRPPAPGPGEVVGMTDTYQPDGMEAPFPGWRCATSPSASRGSPRSTRSASPSSRAASTRSSAPTARASRPASTCCRASTAPPRAACGSATRS